MQTFHTGTAYTHRWAGTFTVTRRTAKFVTLTNQNGDTMRVGVKDHDGVEFCYPLGTYSQCPVLKADQPATFTKITIADPFGVGTTTLALVTDDDRTLARRLLSYGQYVTRAWIVDTRSDGTRYTKHERHFEPELGAAVRRAAASRDRFRLVKS